MYGYRDMTFCSFYEKCMSGSTCFRALTEEIKNEADLYGKPIAQFVSAPKECFLQKEKENENES